MTEKIVSFDQVELTKDKTLILCDIDDTIFHYPNRDEICNNIFKEFYSDLELSVDECRKELNYLRGMYKILKDPEHTDYVGFVSLLKRLDSQNGKLVLLTARDEGCNDITKADIETIGLNSNDFEIYYTSNRISKGEYIKKNIDISEWDDVIFIDDNQVNIQSVLYFFPAIRCYMFCKK
jgi:hypothetical protein